MRVPFAFLFCTIVGLKKLEMGASIHRPIFARGPAHYSAEEKRYYSTYTLRTYFFTYTTARRRWFPPLVCGHYRHFLRLGHCALCVVAAANDTVHVGGEKERGILRIVQEKNIAKFSNTSSNGPLRWACETSLPSSHLDFPMLFIS